MESEKLALTAWSYALAAVVYLALALRLFWTVPFKGPWSRSTAYLLLAVTASALWGALELVFLWSGHPAWFALGGLADLVRYAGWFGFMLALCHANRGQRLPSGIAALPAIGVALVVIGLVVQVCYWFDVQGLGKVANLMLMSAMSLAVFALVLLEQVYRNVTDDSRWNVKPVSLGLAGSFLFDLYLYSQAVLFNQLDTDALSIRGAVHALMVPLIFLSTTRRRDWISKIRLSQKAAFHSATLFSAGLYLLFISASVITSDISVANGDARCSSVWCFQR